MKKMSIKKDDLVVVLSGKDKGKQGKVLEVQPKSGKVVVENINVVSRHTKPRKQGDQGGILKKEAPIYACKVQRVCPKCGAVLDKAYVGKKGKEEKKEESPTNLANEYLALYQKTDAALEEWEKMHRRLADYFQQIR